MTRRRGIDIDDLKLPEVAFIVFNTRILRRLIESFRAKRIKWLHSDELYPIGSPHIARVSGRDVAIIIPCWGASCATSVLEEMIVCGSRIFIVFGLCGSLVDGVGIGDLVVARDSLIDEGTSRIYSPRSRISRADPELTKILFESCRKHSQRCHLARIWSTDAPYMETAERVSRFRSRRASCVDMETSAIYTLSRIRGVRASAIHIVSDSLSGDVWRPMFFESIEQSVALLPKIATDVLKQI